jgi:hypothetical protein
VFLSRTSSDCIRAAGPADLDRLWDLYLSSGFLHPARLESPAPRLTTVKETLACLLWAGEDLCRIHVHEREGQLTCALSAVRAYEKTWLVQHMACPSDPHGMRAVLLRTMAWLMEHRETGYGLFTFRPEDRSTEAMLRRIRRSLPEQDAGFSLRESFDYYLLDIASLGRRLRGRSPSGNGRTERAPLGRRGHPGGPANRRCGVEVSLAAREDYPSLALALERRFGRLFCELHSLQPEHFTLAPLGERFRACGLGRRRRVYTARFAGVALAVALAEQASPGTGFSMLLDRFQILPLVNTPPPRLWRVVTRRLLSTLCAHYARTGRHALVGLCPESERGLYRELGFSPLTRYGTLALTPQSASSSR